MRIFLFLSLSLLVWGCSTVEVTKEVIKVTNAVTNKVKDAIPNNKNEENVIIEEIIEENAIEEEIEIIEEKQEEEKSIVESQQKSAEINFIGKTEDNILNVMGAAKLSRIDGSVYTLRYDSINCRLFLFFNKNASIKRVEYFELRNKKAELLSSEKSMEQCYKELKLFNFN
ncbi:hypothetical protein N8080_00825 [Alphaproteobacteria bacterium]|nr:hypothetical protein [Alphaproteobacteria bacterium]